VRVAALKDSAPLRQKAEAAVREVIKSYEQEYPTFPKVSIAHIDRTRSWQRELATATANSTCGSRPSPLLVQQAALHPSARFACGCNRQSRCMWQQGARDWLCLAGSRLCAAAPYTPAPGCPAPV
jgi:hypothetical protein